MLFLKNSIISLIMLLSFTGSIQKESFNSIKETCLSAEELKLYNLINAYRKQKGLAKIPLSKSLTYVAQTHAKDLMDTKCDTARCNAHSWSNKGKWTSCCYTPDHKQKECMWDKPKELTSYTDTGYEIAFYYSRGVKAEQALTAWKESKGHNPLLINSGTWKDYKWQAIGIGIYKNYATVWFGAAADKEGEPKKCVQ